MPKAKPASIPEGLIVRLSRAKVLPGAGAEGDRWMAMLDERVDECVATLDRERIAVQIVFRLREGGDGYLFWVAIKGVGGAGPDEKIPIDRDYAAQARRTGEPGWTEAEPQVLMLPGPVRDAIMSWAVRPSPGPRQEWTDPGMEGGLAAGSGWFSLRAPGGSRGEIATAASAG